MFLQHESIHDMTDLEDRARLNMLRERCRHTNQRILDYITENDAEMHDLIYSYRYNFHISDVVWAEKMISCCNRIMKHGIIKL